MYYVRLLKGLREPYITAQQIMKAEAVGGFWRKLTLLILLTILISAGISYFGIGNEILSKHFTSMTGTEFEATKNLFALGQILWSLFAGALIVTIPSLCFWAVSDIPWSKFVIVQLFVFTILLIEKIITAIATMTMGLPDISNPFSLAILGQTITDNHIILQLLAQITIFKIWTLVLQYKYIKILSEKSTKNALLIVIGFNLIFLLIASFIDIMDLEKLL